MPGRSSAPRPPDAGLDAGRELITRVGNQSNLILDPDLDSYYAMSQSILRYPRCSIRSTASAASCTSGTVVPPPDRRDEIRTRYLVLEGQLDAVLQGLRSDFAEAAAANARADQALGPSVERMRTPLKHSACGAQRSMPAGRPPTACHVDAAATAS